MKNILISLVIFLAACNQPTSSSFADRVNRADQLEATPTGILFSTALLNKYGGTITKLVRECYASNPNLEKDAFVLVADIDSNGDFTNIVVQPETAPSRCYAEKINGLHMKASKPIGFGDSAYPVVLRVKYNK